MTPTEKHRETARQITVDDLGIDTPGRMQDAYIGIISDALAQAEREGMKRAAEIAKGCVSHLQELALDLKQSGDDLGARLATNEARVASGIAGTILSEAGEG